MTLYFSIIGHGIYLIAEREREGEKKGEKRGGGEGSIYFIASRHVSWQEIRWGEEGGTIFIVA